MWKLWITALLYSSSYHLITFTMHEYYYNSDSIHTGFVKKTLCRMFSLLLKVHLVAYTFVNLVKYWKQGSYTSLIFFYMCWLDCWRTWFHFLLFPCCRCSRGARVWKELGHHLLLVPPDSQHHQLHRRHGGPELEDGAVPAGGLDPGLPGCHQGHPVLWEGTGSPWLHSRGRTCKL